MGHCSGRIAVVITFSGLIAACATSTVTRSPVASNVAPPGRQVVPPVATAPAPPAPHPAYKVGEPYQVDGVWYYPQEQPGYDTTGIASWYGQDYQGKPTANGEIFDRNAVTAAHPTLPMPVNVRVTNLENGRSIVVRVNDRGPYINGRLIDVSEHAADLLGFRTQGLARVRVTFLGRADLNGPGLASLADETPPEIASAVPAAPVSAVEVGMLAPVMGVAVAAEKPVSALPVPVEQTILPALPQAADGQVIEMAGSRFDGALRAGRFFYLVDECSLSGLTIAQRGRQGILRDQRWPADLSRSRRPVSVCG